MGEAEMEEGKDLVGEDLGEDSGEEEMVGEDLEEEEMVGEELEEED